MGYIKFALAAAYAAGLLMFPETALTAARSAMEMWYLSVAPALFPFAAMMPYLTSPQARYIYDKILGRFMALFDLPGRCAPALVAGFISGSPGGALAVASVAASEKLARGQVSRLAALCCTMSPVYLVSGLGCALMGSAADGWRMVFSQWIAALLAGIMFRGCWKGGDKPFLHYMERDTVGIMNAVAAVMRACGFMVLFAVGISVAEKVTGLDIKAYSIFLDLPGCASAALDRGLDGCIIAAAAGFGGLCIALQNMNVLKNVGVSWGRYMIQKAAVSILSGAAYTLMDKLPLYCPSFENIPAFEAVLIVILMVSIPVTWAFFRGKRCDSI